MSSSVTARRPRLASHPRASAFLFLVLSVGSVLASSCRSRDRTPEPVEVEVRQVGFDHSSHSPVVILQDKNGDKAMPIWIGLSEAQAIALQLHGATPPRPLTHDLLKNILDQVGVEIDKVLVSELKESTYYARIHLLNGTKEVEVDSRPSDAIALALRFHRPIFVERKLFESAPSEGTVRETTEREPEKRASVKLFGMTVQELNASLAAYFALPEASGVLITDVEKQSGAARLQRGDVITAVNGEKVRDIDELRRKLEKEQGRVVTFLVQRDGQEKTVPFSILTADALEAEEESQ